MKKNLHKNFSIVLLVVLLITGCAKTGTATPSPQLNLRIGYCPTMQDEVIQISGKYSFVELIKYDSSAKAIQSLQAKEIDAVLVGRKPFSQEISSDLMFHQLKPGATLVSQKQGYILYEEISKITIHTSLAPEEADKMLPKGTHIIYYQDNDPPSTQGQNLLILKDWDQVENDDQLVIPVNGQGEKIRIFRTPFLLYPKSNGEKLESFLAAVLPNAQE